VLADYGGKGEFSAWNEISNDERRTCDYLHGMRARGHGFKLPDFSTILHKKSFLVSALYMYM